VDITKEEYQKGRVELKNKIKFFQPKIVCFVGKGVYQEYSGLRELEWGRQEKSMVEGTIDFVAPSSSGLVRMKKEEILRIYRELNALKNRLSSHGVY
jgi:TDG/mug DNA glycosylase family protein